ncbi:MAG: DUF3072 domain-containing protein [Epulopiscium sp.]|nr:DUF3072 domain-containing protein [Candidatus Epulonipiscium sp.]
MYEPYLFDQFVVFDLETTGCNPERDQIIEIGAIKVKKGQIVSEYQQLVHPQMAIPSHITEITGITNEMVYEQPHIHEVLPEFLVFCESDYILGHNILFDYKFIKYNVLRHQYTFEKKAFDTLKIARNFLKHLPSRSLGAICEYYSIDHLHAHRALDDARVTYEVFLKLKEQFFHQDPEIFNPQPINWEPKKLEPITIKQKNYLKNLLRMQKRQLDRDIEDLTKSEASRWIDSLLREMRQAR